MTSFSVFSLGHVFFWEILDSRFRFTIWLGQPSEIFPVMSKCPVFHCWGLRGMCSVLKKKEKVDHWTNWNYVISSEIGYSRQPSTVHLSAFKQGDTFWCLVYSEKVDTVRKSVSFVAWLIDFCYLKSSVDCSLGSDLLK